MTAVTVVVPLHDAREHLPGLLAALDNADTSEVRFVMVDDASTDGTGELLADAARTRPIEVLRNDANLGAAASRNRALERVDTRYLMFFDADDWCTRDHFRSALAAIRELGTDFVRFPHVRVTGLHREIDPVPGALPDQRLAASDGIGTPGRESAVDYAYLWAGIYDTERIPADVLRFDETLLTAADRPWFWRLHLTAESFAVRWRPTYFYRKGDNPAALTQAGGARSLHIVDAYQRVRDLVVPTGRSDWIDKAAYSAAQLLLFHIDRRARLSPELQRELFRRGAELLHGFPADSMERARRAFGPIGRIVLGKVLAARWTP